MFDLGLASDYDALIVPGHYALLFRCSCTGYRSDHGRHGFGFTQFFLTCAQCQRAFPGQTELRQLHREIP